MSKLYRVTFDVKKHGDFTYAIDLEAQNSKSAREFAERLWYANKLEHMFHIVVRRIADDEEFLYHWFTLQEVMK